MLQIIYQKLETVVLVQAVESKDNKHTFKNRNISLGANLENIFDNEKMERFDWEKVSLP